jgi:tetratricopeptide (TPR) repeat protein
MKLPQLDFSIGRILLHGGKRHALTLARFIASKTPTPGKLQTEHLSDLDLQFDDLRTLFERELPLADAPWVPLHNIYICIGSYLSLRGYYEEKKRWGQALMRLLQQHEQNLHVGIINSVANAHDDLGEYEPALQLYQLIVRQFAHQPDHPALGVVYYNLSRVYRNQGNLDYATHYYKLALVVEEQSGDVRGLAMSQMGLADMLSEAGEYEQALSLAEQALHNAQLADDAYLSAQYAADVATHSLHVRDPATLIPLFQSAILQLEALNDQTGLAKTLFNYALLRGSLGFGQEAHALGQRSAALYEQFGSPMAAYVRQIMASWPPPED